MDVEVKRDGYLYNLHFEKGENVGGLKKVAYEGKDTGTKTRWKPDLEVFTDIKIPDEYFMDVLKRQAVVNDGLVFVFKKQHGSRFETKEFCYKNGIQDYLNEYIEEDALNTPQFWSCERKGKDREDKPEYKVKINVALAFSNKKQLRDYYHNSSFLEYGGSPEKAVRYAVTAQIDKDAVVKAPGMKYKHYAPQSEVVIVSGSREKAAAYIHAHYAKGERVLCFEEELTLYQDCDPLAYGKEADVATLSAGLFAALRELDDPSITKIYARCPVGGGVAYAVQNRLKKAAAFHIIDPEEL